MATIRTAIQIQDGMTAVFRSMNNAINIVLNSFEALQNKSSNAVDTSSIQAARQELAKAEVSFNKIDQNIQQASGQQQNSISKLIMARMQEVIFLIRLNQLLGFTLDLQQSKEY